MTTFMWIAINQNNIPSEMVKEYCQRSEYLPFTDTALTEVKPHFSKEKISHGCCRLYPEVAIKHNENKIRQQDNASQCLEEKFHLLMLLPVYFYDKMIRIIWLCICQ